MNYEEHQEEFLDKMNVFKEEYYKTNTKNMFFKNAQRKDYNEKVCNNFDLSTMIENAVKVYPETNHVLLDYQLFKMFACENNYDKIIDYIVYIFDNLIRDKKTIYIQVNIKGLSASGLERYRSFMQLFYMKGVDKKNYSFHIEQIVIYNTPKTIDYFMPLVKTLIDKNIYNKIVLDSPSKCIN